MNESNLTIAIIICVATDVAMNLAVAWNVYRMRKQHKDTMNVMRDTLGITRKLGPCLKTAMEDLGNQMLIGVKQLWKGYYGKAKQAMGAATGETSGLVGQVKTMVNELETLQKTYKDRGSMNKEGFL